MSPSPLLPSVVPHLRPIAVALCATLIGGCARPQPALAPVQIEPVTVSRELAYGHPIETVAEAYRSVMEGLGLRVDTDASGALTAVTRPTWNPGHVRVTIGPSDTLATRVSISYRYEGMYEDFNHWPHRLPIAAARRLDSTFAMVTIPQQTFPKPRRSCPALPGLPARAENPSIVGGPGAAAGRVEYTKAARAAEVQGIVYLAVLVNEHGRVTCVEVLSGLPHGLTESAARAMLRTEFSPARLDGRPIAVRVIQPVWFKLLD